MSNLTREEYHFYRQRGFCTYCHHKPAAIGYATCPECHEKISEKRRQWQAENKEALTAYKMERYYRQKAEGVCIRCGHRPARNGRVLCANCAGIENARDREQRRLEQPGYGICYRKGCGKPVKPGYKSCQEHWAENSERARRNVQTAIARGTFKNFGNYPFGYGSKLKGPKKLIELPRWEETP